MESPRTSPLKRHDNLLTGRAGYGARCESLERRTLFAGTPLYVTESMTPAGLELSIEGSRGDDRISVVAYGNTLMLANKGGWSLTVPNHFALININAAKGNDVVIVDGSVTTDAIVRGSNGDDTISGGAGDDRIYGGYGRDRILGGPGDDTIVTIGDSVQDRVSGGDGFDSFWTDSNRSEIITDASADEWANGGVNRVAGFYPNPGPASLASNEAIAGSRDLGAHDLPDPKPLAGSATYTEFTGLPLFPTAGPQATDVKQGWIGDCYFLAPLASLAQENPDLIRRLVVELGDGTYAVRFRRDGGSVYVRVDNDLVISNGVMTPLYAKLGPEGAMWVAIVEKAFANFRRGEGTYASLHSGWMNEAFGALGFASETFYGTNGEPIDVLARAKTELNKGAAVTWATGSIPAGIPLIADHVYTIDDVQLDAEGQPAFIRLLNPWGSDGGGNDGADDGYVTLTAAQGASVNPIIEFAYV